MAASSGPLLICYDGSENARYAIERAATLFAGSRAVVLTVWRPTVESGGMVWFEETANLVDFAELDRAAAERGGRLADEGARIARAGGIEAEPTAVKAAGPVWKTIVEISERDDASVVVMGSRGLTGIRSLVLGSVSNAVVHHARQPALVIHMPTTTPRTHRRNRSRAMTVDVRIKRIYDEPATDDGYRVLIDHVWPRGVSRDRARLDDWARDLAPSDDLRRWFAHDPERFTEFRARYRDELAGSDALRDLAERAASGPVTILYAARDRVHNNAIVVAGLLRDHLL